MRFFFGRLNLFFLFQVKIVRPDSKVTDEESEALLKQLDFLEKFLVDDYLVGNSVTIADLAFILRVLILVQVFPTGDKFPKILAYVNRMKSWKHFSFIQAAIDEVWEYAKMMTAELAKK